MHTLSTDYGTSFIINADSMHASVLLCISCFCLPSNIHVHKNLTLAQIETIQIHCIVCTYVYK